MTDNIATIDQRHKPCGKNIMEQAMHLSHMHLNKTTLAVQDEMEGEHRVKEVRGGSVRAPAGLETQSFPRFRKASELLAGEAQMVDLMVAGPVVTAPDELHADLDLEEDPGQCLDGPLHDVLKAATDRVIVQYSRDRGHILDPELRSHDGRVLHAQVQVHVVEPPVEHVHQAGAEALDHAGVTLISGDAEAAVYR